MQFPPRKNKSNVYCSVDGCQSLASKHETVRFYRFPRKNDNVVKIINNFGEEESIDRHDAWVKVLRMGKKVTPSMTVCSLHFTKDNYIPSLSYKHYLKKTAVPSVNLPRSLNDLHSNKSNNVQFALREERQQKRVKLKNKITINNDAREKKSKQCDNLNYNVNFQVDNCLNDEIEEEKKRKELDKMNLDCCQLSAIEEIVNNFETCITTIIDEAFRNLKKVGINFGDAILLPKLSSVIFTDNSDRNSCDTNDHCDHSYSCSDKKKIIEENSRMINVIKKFESSTKLNVKGALKQFNDVGIQKKPPVNSSDSTNGTSNRNRNARKRRLKLPTESDTEPEDQSVDDVDEEFVLFGKHVASKLNQMPFYNALQCQEKIEALINDELLIVQSRQEEIDTRLIKQEPEISDEFCDENNIMKKIKQEPSMIDEGRLLVQSCQNEIETVIIKQEPGISDELCDENNTPTLLNQVPASPFSLYSIKTENIPDTELQ